MFDPRSPLETRVSLLKKLQKGAGDDPWREFYAKYRHYVLSMAVRLGLDADQAQDVLQMVMMVVLREARGFFYDVETGTFRNASVMREGETHSFVRFRSWLKGVVQIKVWEVRKFTARGGLRLQDGTEALLEQIPDAAPQPDEAADAASEMAFRQAMLDQALILLRDTYRGSRRNIEVFEQVVLCGLSANKVAEAFGISEVHVRQIVHTLRQRLKEIMKNLMHEDPDS